MRSSLKRPWMAPDGNYRPQRSWKFLIKERELLPVALARIRVEEFMRDPRLGEHSGKFERRQLQGNVLSCTTSPLVQQSLCSRDGVMNCRYFGGCGGEA